MATAARTYEEACAAHRWDVPARYNIAADVCDKHPRDKLAMVWEDWRGNERSVSWGELQDLAGKSANVLRDHGVERGDRVAMLLPPTPETAAAFFGTWKAGRSCSRCRCSTATTASATASPTPRPRCS